MSAHKGTTLLQSSSLALVYGPAKYRFMFEQKPEDCDLNRHPCHLDMYVPTVHEEERSLN